MVRSQVTIFELIVRQSLLSGDSGAFDSCAREAWKAARVDLGGKLSRWRQ